jgi:hypothetical protein
MPYRQRNSLSEAVTTYSFQSHSLLTESEHYLGEQR